VNVSEFDHESECELKSECVFEFESEFESEFECVTMSISVAFMMGWLGDNRCARLSYNPAHVWLQGTD